MNETQFAIIKKGPLSLAAFLDCDKLQHVQVFDEESFPILQSIYVGKVKNIVKNINACFVEIRKDFMCYLSMSEGDFRCGDEIVVQVKGASVKSKLPSVTTKWCLSGKYMVFVCGKRDVSISRKIDDTETRNQLSKMFQSKSRDGFGVIVRTNCENALESEIMAEYDSLYAEYQRIKEIEGSRTCFSCLYSPPDEMISFFRDWHGKPFERIITDNQDVYTRLQEKGDFPVEFYEDSSYGLNELLGIESKLQKFLMKKVWLKSGGSLVIEPTEALTSIDVNTEKAIKGNRNPETTYFKINLEAAQEIARQLRIRNLSGIIIIDFIDMKREEHNRELIRELRNLLKQDAVKTMVIDMTPLGLVEVTRMKQKPPLYQQLKGTINEDES